MKDQPEVVTISEFKATCLARLERVRRTGQRLLITKRGEPVAEVVPPRPHARSVTWLGSAVGTGRILDDLIEPVAPASDWESAR